MSGTSPMSRTSAGAREAFARIEAQWRPRPVETTEFLTAAPAQALAAVFDQPPVVSGVGDPLPPLWHWLYLLDRPAQAELGEDGHPHDGLFLPPLPERRRMFGGGRSTFHAPLRVGDLVTRRSEIVSVRVREGGSGLLLLVTVRHTYSVQGGIRTVEEQDIVYKQPGGTAAGPPRPAQQADAAWAFTLRPDPSLLFRFSALTYNAHRIHYDREYARDVEGYPDLVVHGPLLALSLLELPRCNAPERTVTAFSFRAKAPLFAPHAFEVRGMPDGDTVALEAGLPGAVPGITGTASLA
ncbi:FAS1-like dehydratase domain-containing protein [Streptomyces longispororuber]|uniref:FAS1-like dehydratase domain-containing protein n=1 Tax=Streptomyces longispororuber TaxID=68230 RepID=UPI00210F099E|nr:MaoC family dehydratase N-terminal domain-containing protein [Streptomyces longispororuber]MCQ4214121.1 MaoC family dehydratase N-terminal domain-containing protein [Streptomyces longispororuber]